jgi:hypothetical protein
LFYLLNVFTDISQYLQICNRNTDINNDTNDVNGVGNICRWYWQPWRVCVNGNNSDDDNNNNTICCTCLILVVFVVMVLIFFSGCRVGFGDGDNVVAIGSITVNGNFICRV